MAKPTASLSHSAAKIVRNGRSGAACHFDLTPRLQGADPRRAIAQPIPGGPLRRLKSDDLGFVATNQVGALDREAGKQLLILTASPPLTLVERAVEHRHQVRTKHTARCARTTRGRAHATAVAVEEKGRAGSIPSAGVETRV